MPARPFEIRYPDGDFESAYTRRPSPTVGQKIQRKNRVWDVIRREDRHADGASATRPSRRASALVWSYPNNADLLLLFPNGTSTIDRRVANCPSAHMLEAAGSEWHPGVGGRPHEAGRADLRSLRDISEPSR